MKFDYIPKIFTVLLTLLVSNVVNGSPECEEPVYPDQAPHNPLCSKVPPITSSHSNSPVEISPSGTSIAVSGGLGAYKWTISGSGFSFESVSEQKTIKTDQQQVTVYAIDSCGSAEVTVFDGCNSVNIQIRTTTGQWTLYEACGDWYGAWVYTEYVNGEKWVFDWICADSANGFAAECNSQPLVYNENDINCAGGNYPCSYSWAKCHDSMNPNERAIGRYRKYKLECSE